jgi:hypothetical protein
MEKEYDFRNICEKIFQKYNEEKVKESFMLLSKLLNNILTKPNEDKFRLFKKSNEAIKSKILIIKENLDLVKSIGYIELDEEILAFQGNDFTNVKTALNLLNQYIDTIDKQLLEKKQNEEKMKFEQQLKYQKDIDEQRRLEKEKQKKILEQLEADKKERLKKEKPTDSIGNTLNYGAKVCKFEPKNNQRG